MSQLKQIFYASTQPLVVNKFSFLITKQLRAPILQEEVFLLLANIDWTIKYHRNNPGGFYFRVKTFMFSRVEPATSYQA